MKFRFAITAVVCMIFMQVAAVEISNRYRSPRNPERGVRLSTDFIILHTTEAPAKSSLNKVSERGECHFVVTEEGSIYRIVDRDREAFHAGRSMWNGREDIDKYSIGIECVGYHDKPMPLIQLYAIRDLVKELKTMYKLSDDRVMTHSQVAYGAPNKWQKCRHRGRKRCGMLFAMPSVRRVLNLKSRVAVDPDTRAKRLTIGDPYLQKILYGSTDTMRNTYANVPATQGEQKTSGGFFSWFKKTDPTPVATSKQGSKPAQVATPKSVATKNAKPVATPKPAQVAIKPVKAPTSIKELQSQGYKMKGKVSAGMTASKIAGSRWNNPTTFYTIRDKVIPGNRINPARIEVGMCVWMK